LNSVPNLSTGFSALKYPIMLASLICFATAAPSAEAETLREALAKAYLSNPTILAARARLRAVDEGVPEALSGWRPTVTINYDIGRTRASVPGGAVSNFTPRTGSATLDQNIYAGGRTIAETQQAEQEVFAERARLATVEQDTLFEAATAYVDVRRDGAIRRLNQSNERVLRRQLDATRDRFQVGEVTRTDVAQAESRLAGATAARILAAGNLAQSRAAYLEVIGDSPTKLEPAKTLKDLPRNRKSAIKLARKNSPVVVAARFEERSAAADIKVETSDLLPTIGLRGVLSRTNDISSSDSRRDASSVTARLAVPLYRAGAVSARIRAAKQTHSRTRKELDAALREAIADVIRAWEVYQTAVAQIKAFNTEVRSSKIALEGVRQEAQVGSRTVLDVLDAEQELLIASVNLVRAQRDEVVASFDVRRRVGTLQAAQLGLGVPAYDFAAYYKKVRNKWYGWWINGR
jgi:outer membrane protein